MFIMIIMMRNSILIMPRIYSICPNCFTGRKLSIKITQMNDRMMTVGDTWGEKERVGSGYPAASSSAGGYLKRNMCEMATNSAQMRIIQPNLMNLDHQYRRVVTKKLTKSSKLSHNRRTRPGIDAEARRWGLSPGTARSFLRDMPRLTR
jgi:hypothetical protein